jgi:aryl-alcohol dehydrogenase-like predicted oxidoreductase
VGEEFDHGRSRFDFSPEHTRISVLRSLQRLRTEVLDIVLVHSNGRDQEIMERMGTLEMLAQLKAEGLVRAFGMSTKTVAGGLAAAQCCDVVMLTYNAGQRAELPVLDDCARLACGALLKKTFASGHLFSTGPEAGHCGPCDRPADTEADGLLQASMDLVFAHPGTSAAIIGTLDSAHLQADVEAARRAVQRLATPGGA